MWDKLFKLVGGFLCGYFFIKCVPVDFPFHPSDLLVQFLFNPLEFFGASVFFLIGVLFHADLIKEGAELTSLFIRQKQVPMIELVISISVLISFILLLITGLWQTVVFFCFSVFYGMISLDFQKLKAAND